MPNLYTATHYKDIARVLGMLHRFCYHTEGVSMAMGIMVWVVAEDLAKHFKEDNTRFDEHKFLSAITDAYHGTSKASLVAR